MDHDSLLEPSWADAHAAAYAAARPVPAERVPLVEAVGRVLAEPAVSLMDLPRSTTSAMDGWVVSGETGPWELVGSSLAGHPMRRALAPGTAAVIATGGVVPAGAFGVLRRELGSVRTADGGAWTEGDGPAWVHADPPADGPPAEPVAGSHVRPAGLEAAQADVLVAPGRVLTPPQVGLAAMAGNDGLTVHRPVTAALLVMGDEVRHDGLPGEGEVRDAFAPQLPHLARMLGLVTGPATFVADTLDAAVEAIRACEADVVLTTGGTAAGPADYLHRALTVLGAELVVDTVAMRPGHPVLLARLQDGRSLVGLPGNPLSAMAGVLTIVRPLALGLRGLPPVVLGRAVTAEAVGAPAHDTRLVPYARVPDVDGLGGLLERDVAAGTTRGVLARPTAWLGSGMLRGLAGADGVLVVPPGGVQAGAVVPDLPLPW